MAGVEPLGDEHPPGHVGVPPLLVEGIGGVQGREGGAVILPRGLQGGLELVQAGPLLGAPGFRPQDLGGPVQRLLGLGQVAPDPAGVAVDGPGMARQARRLPGRDRWR